MKLLRNVREVLETLKRRRPSQIYCPRCCSPNMRLYSSLDLWLTPKRYMCEKCGYTGSIIMELEKEESEKSS